MPAILFDTAAGAGVRASSLRCDVMRPSGLREAELTAWHAMLAAEPALQRAFLSPGFALACERAHGRAYVAVLHEAGTIRGFFPFQFADAWKQRLALAERIGGGFCDGAGLIARTGLSINAGHLLRLCRVAMLHVTHLMEGQEQFGLTAEWTQRSYVSDIRAGGTAFLADLLQRDRALVRDTERCLRKAEKTYGPLRYDTTESIPAELLADVINEKRQQYRCTQVQDPFARPTAMRLIEALNAAPAADCRLVLARFHAGDRVLAQHLGLQHHGVLSYWFPVYDPEARNVSPGRLLLWRIIENAGREGIGLIDYGEGDAQYKRELATGSMRLGRAVWTSGTLRSVVARVWQSAAWRIARWRRMSEVQAADGT